MIRTVLCCLLLAVLTGCRQDPPARYDADLMPCSLLPDKTARSLVGVRLPAGEDSGPQKFLGMPVLNRYCKWKYEAADHPRGNVVRYKRELSLGLVVRTGDGGGSEAAAKDVRERRDRGQQAVTGIGQQAWWHADEWGGWPTGTLVFRRDNAVVTIELTGYDCCRTSGLGSGIPAKRLRDAVTALARAVDKALQNR